MKPTKTDLKEAVNWLSTKAYEKEDAPILLAEYKRFLIFRVFKFIILLLILSLPIILISIFIKTESITVYTTFEDWVSRICGIFIMFGYGNGIYALFYNKSLYRK